jgi:large subunit ribosomal protein L22
LKGRSIDEAVAILRNLPMPVAKKVEKIVKSAAANAENNYQLVPDDLRIKAAYADEGTRLHRFRAGPRGRAKPWTRRFAHITIIVEDR